MVQIQRQLFTVDEYYKMAESGILQPSDCVELVRGEIIKMSPIKSFHAGIVNRMTRILYGKPLERVSICIQNPVRIDNFSEPEPDIVIARYRKDDYEKRHPHPADIFLLIEVADTSLSYDQEIKAPLYAEAGIPEYWIVNIPERQVEIFREPTPEGYLIRETLSRDQTANCESIGLSLAVAEVFPG